MTDDNAPGWLPIASAPREASDPPFLLCARDDLNVFYFVAQADGTGGFILDWDGHPISDTTFGEFVGWRPLHPPPKDGERSNG